MGNIGWGEILVIFIVGLIVVGPERLPGLIQDVRAMVTAARKAISDARDSLNDEFGEEFDDLRQPLSEISNLRGLNPRTAITRTLFDGDDTYLDLLSGKPAAGNAATAATAAPKQNTQPPAASNATQVSSEATAPAAPAAPTESATPTKPATPVAPTKPAAPTKLATPTESAGRSWVDDDVL